MALRTKSQWLKLLPLLKRLDCSMFVSVASMSWSIVGVNLIYLTNIVSNNNLYFVSSAGILEIKARLTCSVLYYILKLTHDKNESK